MFIREEKCENEKKKKKWKRDDRNKVNEYVR